MENAQTGISNPDRFTSCDDNLWTVDNWLVVDTTPPTVELLGSFFWEDQQWVSFSGTSLDWTHGMQVLGYTFGKFGNLADGITGTLSSECFLAQGICTATSMGVPDPQPIAITPGNTFTFGWDESDSGAASTTAGSVDDLTPYLGVDWEISNTSQPQEALDTGYMAGRCDSIITTAGGCVDENYTPTLTYNSTPSANPLVGPVAQHIYTAQTATPANGGLITKWGVPPSVNSSGAPLFRDTNSADQTANNRAACGSVTVPTGDSCDEYPMASTYEGAAFNSDYSIAIVPSSANSSQGGITSSFYTSNRVLDAVDPFYVLAILPNGTASW